MSVHPTPLLDWQIPRYPEDYYIAHCLFDLRGDPKWRCVCWGAITDGPVGWREMIDAVAQHIEDVRALCDQRQGFRIWHIEGQRAHDITELVLSSFKPEAVE